MSSSSYRFPPSPPAATSQSRVANAKDATPPRGRRAFSDQPHTIMQLWDSDGDAYWTDTEGTSDEEGGATRRQRRASSSPRIARTTKSEELSPVLPYSASAPPLSPPLSSSDLPQPPRRWRENELMFGLELALGESILPPASPPSEPTNDYFRQARTRVRLPEPTVRSSSSRSVERLGHPDALTKRILGNAKASASVGMSPQSASPLRERLSVSVDTSPKRWISSPLTISPMSPEPSSSSTISHKHTKSSASETLLSELASPDTSPPLLRRRLSAPLDEATNVNLRTVRSTLEQYRFNRNGENSPSPKATIADPQGRRSSLPGLELTFAEDISPRSRRSPIVEGMSSALRKRSASATVNLQLIASESFSTLRSSISHSVLGGLTSLRRTSTPSPPAPRVSWEWVKAIRVQLHPGKDSSTSANAFLLGLRALERGGTRSWDPRITTPSTPTNSASTTPLPSPRSSSSSPAITPPLSVSSSPRAPSPSPSPLTPLKSWPTVHSTFGDLDAPPTVRVEYVNGASKTFHVDGLNASQIMDQVLLAPPF